MSRHFKTRPMVMQGKTSSVETPMGSAYVTLNYYEGLPSEVFVVLGKAGTEERAAAEAIGRLCSTALQYGTPLKALAKQLRGISSEGAFGLGPQKVLSMPDAVGRVIEIYSEEDEHEHGEGSTAPEGEEARRVG